MPRTEDDPITQTWRDQERKGVERKTYYDEEADEVVVELGVAELRVPGDIAKSPVDYRALDQLTKLMEPDLAEQIGWARND